MRIFIQFGIFYGMLLLATVQLFFGLWCVRAYKERKEKHIMLMAVYFFILGLINFCLMIVQTLTLHDFPLPGFINVFNTFYPHILLLGVMVGVFARIELYVKKLKILAYTLTIIPVVSTLTLLASIAYDVAGITLPVQENIFDFIKSPYAGYFILTIILAIIPGVEYFRKRRAGNIRLARPDLLLFIGGVLAVINIGIMALGVIFKIDSTSLLVYTILIIDQIFFVLGILSVRHPNPDIIARPHRLVTRFISRKLLFLTALFYIIFSFLLMFIVSYFFINQEKETNSMSAAHELIEIEHSFDREVLFLQKRLRTCTQNFIEIGIYCKGDNFIYENKLNKFLNKLSFENKQKISQAVLNEQILIIEPDLDGNGWLIALAEKVNNSDKETHTVIVFDYIENNMLASSFLLEAEKIGGFGVIDDYGREIIYDNNQFTADVIEQKNNATSFISNVKSIILQTNPEYKFYIIEKGDIVFYLWSSVLAADSAILASLSFVTIITFLFLIVMCIPLFIGIAFPLRPIELLRKSVEVLETNARIQFIPLKSEDEIGKLSRSMGKMAMVVQERTGQLNNKIEDLRNFINITVHELKNPLSVFKWTLEMLQEKKPKTKSKKKNQEMMTYLDNSCNRMQVMIENLLQFSRLSEKEVNLQKETVDLEDIARASFDSLNLKAERKNIALNFLEVKDKVEIFVDPNLIRIAIDNFISNAIKYTPEKGTVTVSIKKIKKNNQIRLLVRDTGIGIPQKEKKKIFSQFFRATNVREGSYEGTGLGLNISKRCIELNGGSVGFSSIKGQGSKFWFDLPLK